MTPQLSRNGRKPRIAIMGEFSAGKSTLCNLLMNMRALPEKVTATRIAPVWMTKGIGQHMRVTTDGTEEPIDINDLGAVAFQDTLYIRLCIEAEILDQCDFIDFPGISDPNMDPEVWERMLGEANAVIWLTHATQAWRQSEAAVWDIVPEEIRRKSILLATRFDKVVSEQDRVRVMHRLKKEAGPHFDRIFPISLTDAWAAQDDYDRWTASGATELMDHLANMIVDLANPEKTEAAPADTAQEAEIPPLRAEKAAVKTVGPAKAEPESVKTDHATPRIVPRRVRPSGTRRHARPEAMRA